MLRYNAAGFRKWKIQHVLQEEIKVFLQLTNGMVMHSVISVCLSVCPLHALTFESLDLEILFWYTGTS